MTGSRSPDPARDHDHQRRLTRFALLLGIVSIGLVVLIGGLAFVQSRESLTSSFLRNALERVQLEASRLDASGSDMLDPKYVAQIRQLVQGKKHRLPDTCTFVLGPDGKPVRDPDPSGKPDLDLSRMPLTLQGADAPHDLAELIAKQCDWVGICDMGPDQRFMAAFACAQRTHALVGMFVPWQSVAGEIDRATVPWILGLALIALVLLPLSLWLLRNTYTSATRQREAAERDLAASRRHLQTVAESVPCELWMQDRDGRILMQNPASMRIYGDNVGRYADEVAVPDREREAWREVHARALAGEDSSGTFEKEIDGEIHHFEAYIVPVRGPSGIEAVCGVKLDVTERERALAVSRSTQTRLDLHLENSPLAVIEWDPELCVLRWSAGAQRLFGWKAEEILGQSLWPIIHPEDRAAMKLIVRRLIVGAESRNTTLNRNLTKDGRILRCEWSNSVLLGEDGDVVSYLSIAQDVTERHQAQVFVATHNHVQRLLLDERPLEEVLGALVSGMELQLEARAACLMLVDCSQSSLLLGAGPNLPAPVRAALKTGFPIQPNLGTCGRACTTKLPAFCDDVSTDPLLKPFAPLLEQAGLRSVWSQPILTARGEVLGTLAMLFSEERGPLPHEIEMLGTAAHLASVAIEHVRQTAEEKSLTRRLEALNAIGRALLEGGSLETVVQCSLDSVRACLQCPRTSLSFIGIDRPEGLVVGVSSERPTALPARKKKDRPNFPFDEMDSLHRGEIRIVEDLVRAFPDDPETQLLLDEGVRSCACVPMISRGTLIGTLNVCFAGTVRPAREDLAFASEAASLLAVAILQWRLHEQVRQQAAELEQRVLERTERLTETNAELESYVHTVSHDLRAPLRSIQGFGQALIEDHGLDLSVASLGYLQRMTRAAERMDEMMQELLAYSRLGRAELHRQTIDLEDALASARDLVAGEFGSRFVQIDVERPLGRVLGHLSTLVQVLANLLSNAAKFVPPGRTPRIRISRELDGTRLRLHIEDNGIGIPLAQQERIWSVFERLHGIETYPGTGIGLAIVRRAMERMGGSSGVVSNPAEGSRFWIELDAGGPTP